MVGARGFEPPTSLRPERSALARLSHALDIRCAPDDAVSHDRSPSDDKPLLFHLSLPATPTFIFLLARQVPHLTP